MKKSGIDYIPASDGGFLEWVKILFTYVVAHAAQWGIAADTWAHITPLIDDYEAAYAKATDPNRGKADVRAKNEARDALKAATRQYVREYLASNHLISNGERENMGLPVHDTKPTRAPRITVRPEMKVEFDKTQEHTLVVHDPVSRSAGKPAHVAGFEIWRKVGGDAPATEADWQLVVQAPHSPYTLKYDLSESGLRAYYRVRWVNTRGVPGPWSDMHSAIIP
jgi:hypothetical protein